MALLHLSLVEVIVWSAVAFASWVVLIALLRRLGVPGAALVAAPLSWLLARALMSGVPQLMQWAAHVATMVG